MIYCGYIATYGTSLPSSLTYLVVNSSGVVLGAISHLLTGLKHHSENNKFPMSGSGLLTMKISMISIASHKKRSYYSTEELFSSWSEPMIYIQLLSNIRCTLQYILNQHKFWRNLIYIRPLDGNLPAGKHMNLTTCIVRLGNSCCY